MNQLIQSLLDAISQGAILGLAALAIGLVFGVIRLANFAMAEIITGAGYALVLTWQWGWYVAIPTAIVAAVLFAVRHGDAAGQPLRPGRQSARRRQFGVDRHHKVAPGFAALLHHARRLQQLAPRPPRVSARPFHLKCKTTRVTRGLKLTKNDRKRI